MVEHLYLGVRNHDKPNPSDKLGITRLLKQMDGDVELFNLLFDLKAADMRTHAPEYRKRANDALAAKAMLADMIAAHEPTSPRDLRISGNDLFAIGFTEGPEIGKALSYLFKQVLNGGAENTPEDLIRQAQLLYNKTHSDNQSVAEERNATTSLD